MRFTTSIYRWFLTPAHKSQTAGSFPGIPFVRTYTRTECWSLAKIHVRWSRATWAAQSSWADDAGFPGHVGKYLRRHGPYFCLVYERGQKPGETHPHAHIPIQMLQFQSQQTAFGKGSDSKHLRFCRPDSLCHNYSTLLLQLQTSHRRYVNKWVWLYFNKTLFVWTGRWPFANPCLNAFVTSCLLHVIPSEGSAGTQYYH